MPIEVKLSQNYVHIRPPNSPLKTRETGLQLPEVMIHWRRLEKSAKQSIGCDFDFESLLELKSRPRHILLDCAIIYTILIYMFVYCYWILWLNINSIKIICDRINVKVIRALRGLCASVSKCWKTKSLLKLAIALAVEKTLQLSIYIYNIYIHTIYSGTRLERNLSL